MKRHLICSNPDIYFTDASVEYARNFLTEVGKLGGDANMVIIVRWEEDARQIDPQFTHDLKDLKRVLSKEDYAAELDRRAMMFGVKSEPFISLGASPIDDFVDKNEIHTIDDIDIFIDKSSFQNIGKDTYNIDCDLCSGKMFFI